MPRPRRARPRGPTLKAQQSEATKARLLDAARKLFAEHGYDRVSVTEIAREAGVTHSMINVHFHAKAGLLYALIRESNAKQIEAARKAAKKKGTVAERLKRVVQVFAEGDLEDPDLLAVMQSYFWEWPDDTEAENRIQLVEALAPARSILADGMASGELRSDLDVDRAVRALYAIYTLGLRPAVYDGASVADCVAEIMAQAEMLLEGLRAR